MDFIPTPPPIGLDRRLSDGLHARPAEFDGWVGEAAERLGARLPVPESCLPFQAAGYFRLKRHRRSVCYAPPGTAPLHNVLCVKGMEPYAPDFASALDRLAARRPANGELSQLDHLILREDKLPGCLLFDEARLEACAAADLQVRLASDGGAIAALPFPVLCARLSDEVRDGVVDQIAARTSRALWPKLESLAAGGMGVYAYWYPSVPLRVQDCPMSRGRVEAAANGWIGLAARMLKAGFLPTAAHSLERGQCCNPQNAVIDGGFVDLGSIRPLDEMRTARDVFIALQMTIWGLTATILHALGQRGPFIGQFDYVASMTLNLVRERLAVACAASADPRLTEFFKASDEIGAIIRLAELRVDG